MKLCIYDFSNQKEQYEIEIEGIKILHDSFFKRAVYNYQQHRYIEC